MKTFRIEGMHCQSCVARIEAALQGVRNVDQVSVTLNPPQALISGDHIDDQNVAEAVQSVGAYTVSFIENAEQSQVSDSLPQSFLSTYYPLLLVLAFVIAGAAIFQLRNGLWDWSLFMSDFMGGFFVVFGFFKLLDIRGFANAYQSYDLIARGWPSYGLAYPFIEVGLGVAYLIRFLPFWTNVLTAVLMLIGTAGVVYALMDKRKIRCACLGTVFNLPMSTVTIIEDAGMAFMALVMLTNT